MSLTASALDVDVGREIDVISTWIRSTVAKGLRRRGAVVGVSGGIDSAASAALCARALGGDHVVALLMPEHDSNPVSLDLGRHLAECLGIRGVQEDVTPIVDGARCAERQRDAIRSVFPDFDVDWKFKLALPPFLDGDRLNVTRLVVEDPNGHVSTARLPAAAYLQMVAATNFKQRSRTMMEYYYADLLHYAVCGTPNRLEYDQGFFVKGGDGLADFKPIAHLYKSQVVAVARALGVPEEILTRPPTTDTFSMAQSQDEFYFGLPYEKMDLCLYALNNGISAEDVADAVDLTPEQVLRVFADIQAKRRITRSLHMPAQLVIPVAGPDVDGPRGPVDISN